MTSLKTSARVLLYRKYDDLTLLADFTGRWTRLSWSTALHGGFQECRIIVPMGFLDAVSFLRLENNPGRHFAHLVVLEGRQVRWEGRVMRVAARYRGELELVGLGYWSSARDQRITTVDYSGGAQTVDDIIKDFLDDKCPDINTDQAGIETVAGNVNLTLPEDRYAQDHIIEELSPLGDSSGNVYHFAVWEGRRPYYTARSVIEVDWEVRLRDLDADGGVEQDALWLRNAADAYDGTSRTAGAADADSQALYPVRDALASVPTGATSARAEDARDRFIAERKIPQQTTRFTVVGDPVARSRRARSRLGTRQALRAGDVVRIVDLVPASAASPSLDNIRTFHVLETRYDAELDAVTVVPDRPPSTLAALLARTKIEPER